MLHVLNVVFLPTVSHCMSSMADTEEQEHTTAEDLVITKYKMAADIVNGKLSRG